MGCDIHLYVEAKVDGVWRSMDTWEQHEDVDDGSVRLFIPHGKEFYSRRNYNLFAILADVRNYDICGAIKKVCDSVFEGKEIPETENGRMVNPISAPRGLPNDLSDPVRTEADWWGRDAFDHSWLTVAELMAYDWTQKVKYLEVERTYHDICKDFLSETMPRLQRLGSPENVRIVFWFDN